MVVSLNIGTITVDYRHRPTGRAGVMVAGHIKMGAHDTLIRPQDIELRTIKSIIMTPMMGSQVPAGFGDRLGSHVGYRSTILETYIGSIGVLDTSRAAGSAVGNYVRVRASMVGSLGSWGQYSRAGSALPGSIYASFMAFGE